jgi:hypothetical protein
MIFFVPLSSEPFLLSFLIVPLGRFGLRSGHPIHSGVDQILKKEAEPKNWFASTDFRSYLSQQRGPPSVVEMSFS